MNENKPVLHANRFYRKFDTFYYLFCAKFTSSANSAVKRRTVHDRLAFGVPILNRIRGKGSVGKQTDVRNFEIPMSPSRQTLKICMLIIIISTFPCNVHNNY